MFVEELSKLLKDLDQKAEVRMRIHVNTSEGGRTFSTEDVVVDLYPSEGEHPRVTLTNLPAKASFEAHYKQS